MWLSAVKICLASGSTTTQAIPSWARPGVTIHVLQPKHLQTLFYIQVPSEATKQWKKLVMAASVPLALEIFLYRDVGTWHIELTRHHWMNSWMCEFVRGRPKSVWNHRRQQSSLPELLPQWAHAPGSLWIFISLKDPPNLNLQLKETQLQDTLHPKHHGDNPPREKKYKH